MSRKQIISRMVIYAVLTGMALYTLYPLFFLFINSFKSNNEIIASPVAMPEHWELRYIFNAARSIRFGSGLLVTFLLTAGSVLLIILVASTAAWVMGRSKCMLVNIMYLSFTAAMLIPFQATMYPLLDLFEKMNMKNLPGLMIIYAGSGLSMTVFLYYGFVKSIPASLEEAAVIDGAGALKVFFYVVFPLMKGTTATVIILNSMWIWNDYLLPFLVLGNNRNARTLTLELYYARITAGQYGNPWELIFPAVFITIIPVIVVYVILQKYIVAGVSDGAVKL